MNIIEVRNLCYAYEDDAPALDNVSLNIAAGKTTAVLGGNGAGKSTLFLNLNGVLTPKSGKVFFEGTEVRYSKKELPELRRKIGIVFQDPDDQLFSASVTKDISFGLMKFGLTREEIQERVDRVVRQTGIEHMSASPPTLSASGRKNAWLSPAYLLCSPR
jgi:cobalt/nickel transport system ATP-binding protein